MNRDGRRSGVSRRGFLGRVGTGATAALSGCADGIDAVDDGGGDETPVPPATSTVVRGVERFDTAVVLTASNPNPEFQFQRYSNLNPAGLNAILSFDLANRSYGDETVYGELVGDWTYDPGTLEITLHDDFRYWDGDPVDADNVLLHYELEEYFAEPHDIDAHPAIDSAERTGDYSIRFSLAKDWREAYALRRSIVDWGPKGSDSYYRPWLDRFEDAADDGGILDVVRELVRTGAGDPDPFYEAPFRITDVHESEITCTLRLDAEPVPHYVDDINFTTLEIRLESGLGPGSRVRLFRQGWRPNALGENVDSVDLPFDAARTAFSGAFEPWSILFECSDPPGANVRFRRALAYLTNRKQAMSRRDVIPNRSQTPFGTPRREATFVGDEVLDALEDYGWDAVEAESATKELQRGGFERDSEGQWLYAEGPRAGDPIELTFVLGSGWWWIEDRIGRFRKTVEDWGLGITVETTRGNASRGDGGAGSTLLASRWGGGIPERALETNFAADPRRPSRSPKLPATVEAPPVGEPWPRAEDAEPYDVASMVDTLLTTDDDAAYRDLVDRLTWVYNQTTPRIGVEFSAREWAFNTSRFDVALPEDAADLWTKRPPARVATTGIVDYVPPGRR